jgi:hypothetical protein
VARGNEDVSFLFTMLWEILKDMTPVFCLMWAALIFGYIATRLLHSCSMEACGDWASDVDVQEDTEYDFFSAYGLYFLGDFDTDSYRDSVMAKMLFTGLTCFINLILLNYLIAVMNDTYGRIAEKKTVNGLRNKAKLLLDIENEQSEAQKNDTANFPKWLHFLEKREPAGAARAEEGTRSEYVAELGAKIDKLLKQVGALEGVRPSAPAESAGVAHADVAAHVAAQSSKIGELVEGQAALLEQVAHLSGRMGPMEALLTERAAPPTSTPP